MVDISGQIGKYKIIKKLGSGGFGSVYLAEDTLLQSLRALKIPHRVSPGNQKLHQESSLQTRLLDHPHIVKLLTVDIIDNMILMVMEYVDGTDLEKLIDKQEKLSIPVALRYLTQILSALEFAHNHHVIHRDIRPSNILINLNDDVKIADFGTSTLLKDRQFATTRIGSPPYMAPEQFEGKAVFASDIYSTGCLFYEMLTGFPPVVMANPMEIYRKAKAGDIVPLNRKNPVLPAYLNALVMKMLAPAVSDRYTFAGEVLQDLQARQQGCREDQIEMADIKNRIQARESRLETCCWKCRKEIPGRVSLCPYCGEEQ